MWLRDKLELEIGRARERAVGTTFSPALPVNIFCAVALLAKRRTVEDINKCQRG